jgi:hypothetical protein
VVVRERRDEINLEFLLLREQNRFSRLDVRVVGVELVEIVVPIKQDQITTEKAHGLISLMHI